MFSANSLRTRAWSRWICHSCKRSVSSNSGEVTTTLEPTKSRRLPHDPARTRFAPSPTGYLHLGSLRTALYNYLLAKATGGSFVLRVEDTDQKRTIPDAEQRLYRDLEWAGLQWDEGPPGGGPYGPYRQSSRLSVYQKHAEMLLGSGHAYRCFCTQQRLQAYVSKRSELGQSTEYDRACANIPEEESQDRAAKGEAHVIRFKAPPTYPQYEDLVYGKQKVHKARANVEMYPAFQDPIIIKTDGFPTYHLANVVDDHLMKISHVVRGAEWITSTYIHLALYEAFNWKSPEFAHVSLLTDKHGQKLSKRNMDTSISLLRDNMGIFPDTITNFVALLGWSHGRRGDVMDLRELVENFTMKFTKGDAIVTYDKLWYLQKAHAARYATSDISQNAAKFSLMTSAIRGVLKDRGWSDPEGLVLGHHDAESYLIKLVKLDARNYTTPVEFVDRNKWAFQRPDRDSLLSSPSVASITSLHRPSLFIGPSEDFSGVLSPLELISHEEWALETIRDCIRTIIDHKVKEHMGTLKDDLSDLEVQKKAVTQSWATLIHRYIRWVIAAGSPGPDGAAVMEMLGKDETMIRFSEAGKALTALPAV